MNITKLKQALEIMDETGEGGKIYTYEDELQIVPNAVLSDDQVDKIIQLGFIDVKDDDGSFYCST